MVRAKMVCQANKTTGESPHDQSEVTLSPVVSGSEENELFYKYTPGGYVKLQVVNPSAAVYFEEGKEYYVDFTLVGEVPEA